METSQRKPRIRLKGVRQNNLKGFDLDLPIHQLILVTGLSGSGKSSLAFETLFAEGQRRYIETFSPYARQFFDRMDKPKVDLVEGVPPAIAIEQRNTVRTTRSTVGTMTEISDYLKVLWPRLARLHCRQCGKAVVKDNPQGIWRALKADAAGAEVMITFDLPLSEKLSPEDSLELIAKQGYQRLYIEGQTVRLEEAEHRLAGKRRASVTVVQDRFRLTARNRARCVEACEQAYHFGKGKLTVRSVGPAGKADTPPPHRHWPFSRHLHCARCDIEYREPTPPLFSFNHPLGACPACRGFGRIVTIDYGRAVPDRSMTLAEGVVKPWRGGASAECQDDLMRSCQAKGIPTDVPFHELPKDLQDWVVQGDPDYKSDAAHEWPRAWYGVKGYFRWLESKAYKMHVRVLLSRYRSYRKCPDCLGQRLQPDALLFLTPRPERLTLADFYSLPVDRALEFVERATKSGRWKPGDPAAVAFDEVRSRLKYLVDIGLGYLTLGRATRTLSGGETERVNLTTCLGTRLVNTLFVLDEPSVGLHPRDTARLVTLLETLRDAGNTVVVVEHEASVIRAADRIVDLGPGHGESGGEIVFQGDLKDLLKHPHSLTGRYLSGRKRIAPHPRRPVVSRKLGKHTRKKPTRRRAPTTGATPMLQLSGARRHNLKDLTIDIPLERFVCVSGVSGSGKTTLIREVLLPALQARLAEAPGESDRKAGGPDVDALLPGDDDNVRLRGSDRIGEVLLVDQSSLGKTPRSNPAVYTGAFDDVRELFAQTEAARQRGLSASAFSFNSSQGRCERCGGAGFEKIEMQFLSDVFIRCPDCDGRRYRPHILEVRLPPPDQGERNEENGGWSIGDMLEATVDQAVRFLSRFGSSRPVERALPKLRLLREVGLGYLRLGQPINTLSGGESQRLKLASHLTRSSALVNPDPKSTSPRPQSGRGKEKAASHPPGTLFLFDEPTTGLHFEDVRVLLEVFHRLVGAGHSVLVIEHNLEVIKCADWIIDLGPDAGEAGGRVVVAGPPEDVAACKASHTGHALKEAMTA